MTLKNLLIAISSLLILISCSSRISYDMKNGSNDLVIYSDSFLTIQRSTEVLGDELFISHLVTKKREFKNDDFSFLSISDSIQNVNLKDSISFYESCNFKKYWYKSFTEIPLASRNFKNCDSYQVIYYFDFKNKNDRSLIIKTNTKFSNHELITSLDIIDTLIRNKTYHIPQP